MKKAFYLLAVLALVAVLPGAVLGQSGITWDSEIIIQNVGAADAIVWVRYYYNMSEPLVGGELAYEEDHTVPLGQSIRIYPIDVAAPFNGSVVIESTEPIAVIVGEQGNPAAHDYNAYYEGFELGAQTVRAPILMSDNAGFYTFFNVQNAGPEATTVTVDFIEEPGKGYASIPNETCDIDVGEACTFSQEPGQGAWTVGRWVGGATITAGQPVVAAVNQVHKPNTAGMASYSAFTTLGSPTVVLPVVMAYNYGFWSGINILNAGDATTNVTLTFYPEPGKGYPALAPVVKTGVAAGQIAVVLMTTLPELDPANTRWVGSVEVSGGTEEIFAIVNTLLSAPQSQFSSVKGVAPGGATDTVELPAILSFAALPGWWTGAQIYNTAATTTTVTLTYSTCPVTYCTGGAWTPAPEVKEIGPKQVMIWNHAGTGTQWLNKYYFGAAIATSDDGAGILGLVNAIGAGWENQGDVTNSYNGINR